MTDGTGGRGDVSKYRVHQYLPDADDVRGYGVLVGDADDGRAIVMLTEAEANIIAFALNSIAEGFTLAAYKGGTRAHSIYSRTYTGPTEGVLK